MMQDTLQRGDLFAPAPGSGTPPKLERRVECKERSGLVGVGGVRAYYNANGITLFHGDVREFLPLLVGAFNALVTDPPYPNNAGHFDADVPLARAVIMACDAPEAHWHVRLLSKSNLLPKIAEAIAPEYHDRMIFGVSTGTLDNGLAHAFEEGTPLVSKRIESLHWLQDHGFRTFGMICPSLPQRDYKTFARDMRDALRAERCEHVWGEVINVRGDSMTRTVSALRAAGFDFEADALNQTRTAATWEAYARETFLAHARLYPSGKLRFLQYVTNDTRMWWKERESLGSILL